MLTYLPSSTSSQPWHVQLKMLRSALLHDPANPLAWRWRVRARVLAYLVSRYGGAGNLLLAHDEKGGAAKVVPENVIFFSYDVAPTHSHAFIRRRLREISQINDGVLR